MAVLTHNKHVSIFMYGTYRIHRDKTYGLYLFEDSEIVTFARTARKRAIGWSRCLACVNVYGSVKLNQRVGAASSRPMHHLTFQTSWKLRRYSEWIENHCGRPLKDTKSTMVLPETKLANNRWSISSDRSLAFRCSIQPPVDCSTSPCRTA